MEKTVLIWTDIENLTKNVMDNMKAANWQPSIIVGITRGGLVPAILISQQLSIPMVSLDVSFRDNELFGPESHWIPEKIADGHQILVMDDINDSGETFIWIKRDWTETTKHFPKIGSNFPWETHIKFGSLIHNVPSKFKSDFYGLKINKDTNPTWIKFPWEKQ